MTANISATWSSATSRSRTGWPRRYRDQFQACFRSLLANPQLGRSAGEVAPGLRRIRQQAHVVFYKYAQDELFIVRVLHHSMDFEREL